MLHNWYTQHAYCALPLCISRIAGNMQLYSVCILFPCFLRKAPVPPGTPWNIAAVFRGVWHPKSTAGSFEVQPPYFWSYSTKTAAAWDWGEAACTPISALLRVCAASSGVKILSAILLLRLRWQTQLLDLPLQAGFRGLLRWGRRITARNDLGECVREAGSACGVPKTSIRPSKHGMHTDFPTRRRPPVHGADRPVFARRAQGSRGVTPTVSPLFCCGRAVPARRTPVFSVDATTSLLFMLLFQLHMWPSHAKWRAHTAPNHSPAPPPRPCLNHRALNGVLFFRPTGHSQLRWTGTTAEPLMSKVL